jgi:hypothetical protein
LDRIGSVFLVVIPEHNACHRSDNLSCALQNYGLPRIVGPNDATAMNKANSDPLVTKGKHTNSLLGLAGERQGKRIKVLIEYYTLRGRPKKMLAVKDIGN